MTTNINNQETVIDMNPDSTPILYTDIVFMATNEFGIVFDVAQKVGLTNKARIVTRIGMSREHAKKLVNELGKLLAMTDGKLDTNKKN